MPYKTLRDTVISKLRDEILGGNYLPGEELTVKTLSERFDCSLTPVREALRVLESEGLLLANRHKSVKVSKLDAREVESISEIRILLERYACKLAVSNMTASLFRKLELNLQEQEKYASGENIPKFLRVNWQFHSEILKSTKQPILIEIINMLRNRTSHYLETYIYSSRTVERVKRGIAEHRQILEAMRRKDVDEAIAWTEKHLSTIANTLILYLREKQVQDDKH